MSERRSLITRFSIQMCSRQPEAESMDLMVHTVVLLLLSALYGYFSLQIDSDPDVCWGPNSVKETEIVEP